MGKAFKIAIASGKGGTGKTTVSVNLFHFLHKKGYHNIHLVDCDVEEPDDRFFFREKTILNEFDVTQSIPVIDSEKCTYCRKCTEYCEFNAIVIIPPVKYAGVNAGLCHSCGACLAACKDKAITEKPEPIGKVTHFDVKKGAGLTEGSLKIGSAMQTLLIKELKKNTRTENSISIYDAPPGTSCPVVETISDADFVILVTEPTPFGLYDLQLMVDLLNEISRPFAVIVNKSGLGNSDVYSYLQKKNIELLGEIPFLQKYAGNYATGELFSNIPDEILKSYTGIIQRIEKQMDGNIVK